MKPEKIEFRRATEEESGKQVWWDTCKECGAPQVMSCTPYGPRYGGEYAGYEWKPVPHSCVQNLKKRIEVLEERMNFNTSTPM